MLAAIFVLSLALAANAGTLVQEFYLPMPEAQIYQANNSIISGTGSTIASTFSIIVTGNGTVIYYDQWEDGYEIDLGNPTQPTTQIWGDGNDAHGIPPGFAHNPLGLPAGTVITLTNNVPLPRNPSSILWDARDRIAANKAIIISRAGWPSTTGPVFAGAVSVLSTIDWGTNYISPVGQNLTNVNLFKYVGLFIMAAQDNTSVTIDPGGTGSNVTNIVLNQGESYLVNGGVMTGGRVTATKPIQADLIVGHVGAAYASDWFTLYPVGSWGSAYYTPVGSAAKVSQPAYVYVYNPGGSAITINYSTKVGSGSFPVPASNGVFQFQMPVGSGASFKSAGGQPFYALCTVAANNSADTAFNWGFTLVPQTALTTEADVGWAPGSADGTVDGSPVWVTTLANTILYVDYKGDHAGPLTDPNGNHYDTNFTVTTLQSQKIFDPSKNQTGMRVYTVDGTLLTAAWGEDADTAQPGNPYIDAGTTVLPFPVPVLKKSAFIITDTPPAGLSIGDVIQYAVEIDNKGLLPLGNTVVIDSPSGNLTYVPNSTTLNGSPIPDSVSGTPFPLDSPGYTIPIILSQGTSIFQYQAQVNGAGAVSNSVNVAGTTIFSSTILSPPPANGATVTLNFSDSGGNPVSSYQVGGNVFVVMTNAAGNTSSSTVQTISVTVTDQNSGDAETIVLTETGVNTGVFQNIASLPASSTAGLSQQDGILNVAAGDTLKVSYTDPNFGDSATATATIAFPTPSKQLYLGSTSGVQSLNRIDPVAYGLGPTLTSPDLGGSLTSATLGIDHITSASGSTGTSLTSSHTVSTGTNCLMLVGVSTTAKGGSPATVSSITYGTNTFTLVTAQTQSAGSTKPRMEIWQLVNPPSGTATVTVNFAGSIGSGAVIGVVSFTNANQSTPLSVTNSNTGSSANPFLTEASASGEIVFDVVAADGGTSFTPGAGQTSNWNADPGILGAGSTKPGAASITTSWTNTTSAGWAMGAVSVMPALVSGGSGGTNVTSFVQTTAFAAPFTIASGGTVAITNFITLTNGAMPTNPAVTATLQYNGTNFLTLSNPLYSATSNYLVWTGVMAGNVTVPAGQAITCVISNSQSGVAYHVNYGSTNAPSVIVLPASAGTVVAVNTLGVYDAPYPGGNLVTTPVAGSTVYIRASVSDPFGSYDITSLGLAVTGPNLGASFTNVLTDANLVASDAVSKTYQFPWTAGATTGDYSIAVTAHEGTEGVTATAAAAITTTFLDLGTPSTTTFTSGNNGPVTTTFTAGNPVCIQVKDLNRNTNATTIDTVLVVVSSSTGDIEVVVLSETGTNTGIFTGCINVSTNIPGTSNDGTLFAPAGSILTANYSDPTDPTDNTSATATVQPAPGVPGVVISKTIISPLSGQVGIGQPVTFNLQVVNSGSTTLPNVSVSDTYSAAALSFTAASFLPNTSSPGLLAWTNLGSFAPGQSTNIAVTFNTLAAGTVTNSATANGVAATNSSFVTLLVNRAALSISKTLLSPGSQPVAVGSNVVFRITIQNVGNSAVNYLPLEDTFSGVYYQFVSATIAPNGSGAGSLLWTNLAYPAALATNATITNDITMRVTGQGSPANNTATVDYATDIFGNPVPASSSTIGVNTASASINGFVYNDINQSGIFTNGDLGLSGVTLQLFTDPNGDGNPADGTLVQVTTTDANGYYELLNLTTGHYVIAETLLPGYAGSAPPNNRLAISVTNLTTFTNQNFFQYLPAPSLYSTISGTVWNDLNGNGTNDAGEVGIANVEIDLVQDANANGIADAGESIVASVATDANGNYSFAGVTPGHYVIRDVRAFGYYGITDSQARTDGQIGFFSTNGIISTNNNFYDRLAPVAVADTNATVYGTLTTITPLTNDISPNGDVLTIANVTTLDGIAVINSGSTNLSFTPTNSGNTTLTYTIVDAHGGTSSATIYVSVLLAPLTATAANASRPFGQPNPVFTGTLTGVTNGDNITATYSTAATTNSPAGAYSIAPALVDPNHRLTNYSVTLNNGSLTVLSVGSTVTWTNPLPIVYGTPLGTNQLNATASVPGSFVYNPTNGTVLNTGTNTLSVVFTPTDTNDYTSSTNIVTLVVQPAPLAVTAANASRPFGQPNPVFTGTLTGVTNNDNITATYSSAATSGSPAGTYPIIPALVDPSHRLTNYSVTLNNGTLTVLSIGSTVTWTNPLPIVYGTPLGTNQLNATSSVPGSFVYNPTNGTVLGTGTNVLSVIFTPTDTNDYSGSTNTVMLVVQPAPLTVTAANASRPFGQPNPIFTGTLTGVTNNDNITATYSTAATSGSPAGTYPIVPALVDPNHRLTNYSVTLNNGTLTVLGIGSTVTWTNPLPIVYGTPLGTNQLNATASVPGTFVYTPTNGTVLDTGTNVLSVVFTPTDTNDYIASTNTVTLVAQPAPLTVTAANASRPFGQPNPVFTGTLTGVTNNDNITATYSSSATGGSPAGTYPIIPALVDPGHRLTNYSVTLNNGTLTVLSVGSTVTWTNPLPIVYGTPLGTNQLNASASVPGTFVYNPTNGTVLNAGTNTLSVVFTPTDTNDYSGSTNTVTLVVQPAPLTVNAANASRPFSQPNPVFTGTLTGVTNNDNITATYSSAATSGSPAGTYPIIPTLVDPGHRLTNYSVTLNNGTLTVLGIGSTVTWTNPLPIVYGTPLGGSQLDASANVPGNFAYNPANGAVLNAGTNTLSVVFTPTDTNDYSGSTNTVTLVVSPAPLTVNAANASRPFGQPNPVFTGTLTGVTNNDNITATYSSAATSGSPAGTYPIIPTLVDPGHRLTNYSVTLNNGVLTVFSVSATVMWTNPLPIVYGAALSSNQLNATASVPGSFVYNPTNGTVLNAGTNTLSVVFTPTDTNDYTGSTNTVMLVVQPAPLTVTAANANRPFGQPNPTFTGTLTGVINSDNITATYSSVATSGSPAGTYPIIPTLVDPGHRLTNYSVTLNNGMLTVFSVSATVMWTNPAPIVYGTPLGGSQLDASANVPGNFAYNPANGAVLNAGTNTLSVVFTPTDTNDYSGSTNTVTLVVSPAPLAVTAANASRPFGQSNPVFIGTLTGVTNNDNITATYSSAATSGSPAGTYPIVPALVDPGHRLTNYSVTLNNGTLTVNPVADIAVFETGPTNGQPGQPLTYTITVTNLGPSTATGVAVSDSLPTNVTFISATGGGMDTAGTVTWSIGSLTNGQTTNVTVTLSAPTSGTFTNSASGSSTSFDPNPANNNGSAGNSQVTTTVVAVPQFGILAGTNVLNPQTGLFEEQVVVTNTGFATVLGIQLYVDGLRSGVQLYNASGTNPGRPYVQYNSSLNPGQTVSFLLEFYVPDRQPFTNSLSAVAITNPVTLLTNNAGATPITRVFMDTRTTGQPRFVIEFTSVPGKTYTIIYSDDHGTTWKAATPSVSAGSNSTQWYDDGPPETDGPPASTSSRFYGIIANP